MSLPSTSQSSKISRKETRIRPTECSICYRPADGYHCDVASCKACKTFFRRTYVSKSDLICKHNQDCFDVTSKYEIRLRCKACRYKKCLRVGMNPSNLEFSEEEKDILSSKIDNNNHLILSVVSKESIANEIISMLSHTEARIENLRSSAFNPRMSDLGNLSDCVQQESKISLADKCGPMPGWPLSNQVVVSQDDCASRFTYSATKKLWTPYNTFTTIEYAKTFPFFNQLSVKDRIILAGHVVLICNHLHMAYFAVSRKFEGCLQPDGTEVPQKGACNYTNTAMSVAPLIRCNIQFNEYLLLKAICLCNPIVHGLSEDAQIILTQKRNEYAEILFDYCLKTRPDGPSRFTELLGIIPVLEKQQGLKKNFYILYFAPRLAKCDKIAQFLHDIMFL